MMSSAFVVAAIAEALMAWGFLMAIHLSTASRRANVQRPALQRQTYRDHGTLVPLSEAERLRLAYFALGPD